MTKTRRSITETISGWKWCALASLAIVVLSLLPQLHFWAVRGSDWNGAFTVIQGDELLYAAHVNALIDNRPRRIDPPAGRDDHPEAPLPESLFSIQFIPASVISFFAKTIGISASTAFILLLAVEGLLASLALCWLFSSLTGDRRVAAVAILVVLIFGAVAGGHGMLWLILKPEVRLVGLPFLRRYEPGVPFPLCFVFCTLTWKALTASSRRAAITWGFMAGVTIVILVFSYFYLWTAMFAWLLSVVVLWLMLRWADAANVLRLVVAVSLPLVGALGVFFYLLSKVPEAAERAQALVFTHQPDLLRVPEVIGILILVSLVVAVRRGLILRSDPRLIFTFSFALLPFLVFNQQAITGRSLQPFHYEIFIANYIVLASLVMFVKLINLPVRRRSVSLLVLLCLAWGSMEVIIPSPVRAKNDVTLDRIVPVLRHLDELARTDGTWQDLRAHGKTTNIVFSPEYGISRLLPIWAPQGLLIATGSGVFHGLSDAERREAIYLHLYYCGKDEEYLRELLNDRIDDPYLTYFIRSTLFGPDRILFLLGWDAKPVSHSEIESEVAEYARFARSFSRSNAAKRPVTYVVTPAARGFDFSRIDQWYERDQGERVGDYVLYRVRLRD